MSSAFVRSFYDISQERLLFLIKLLIYVSSIILGMIITYHIYGKFGFSFLSDNLLLRGLTSIYSRIGEVSYGLIPLTCYLMVLIVHDGLYNTGFLSGPASRRGYFLILFAAPNLGLLGTFISLGHAFTGMDISQGLQPALASLGSDIGQALDSTKYGICLAIAAYPFLLFINKGDAEADDCEV